VLQLLSHLQELQQLTHLGLPGTFAEAMMYAADPPAEAFSALTASSKLQHLDTSNNTLPALLAGVWQHLFPAGMQLPYLTSLDLSSISKPSGRDATAPEGSLLVSCCPGLQSLDMQYLECHRHVLAPLRGLTGLHTLRLATDAAGEAAEGFEEVCQLTGLRRVDVMTHRTAKEGLLLQLAQLKQLTGLVYLGPAPNNDYAAINMIKTRWVEPY
jgi:hypothetical protein